MMKQYILCWSLACVAGMVLAQSAKSTEPVAQRVTEKVDVIALLRADAVDFNIGPQKDVADDPRDIFLLRDNQLVITGRGWGYMATKAAFKDYHLVLDFKWTGKVHGSRMQRARDTGLLVHMRGEHGLIGKTWPASIEANIIEGGMGDFIVLSGTRADGTPVRSSITCEVTRDRDKEWVWSPGAARQVFTKGRVNWQHRDENWVDQLDFRGQKDYDCALGMWNRMEMIVKGDTLRVYFNGHLVNEAFDVQPAEGRICIQTECAELMVRHFALYPLGQFTETWK